MKNFDNLLTCKSMKYKIIGMTLRDSNTPLDGSINCFKHNKEEKDVLLNTDLEKWALNHLQDNQTEFVDNEYDFSCFKNYHELEPDPLCQTKPNIDRFLLIKKLFNSDENIGFDNLHIKFDNPTGLFIIRPMVNGIFSFVIRPHKRFIKKNGYRLILVPYCLMKTNIHFSTQEGKLFLLSESGLLKRWPYGNVYDGGVICYGGVVAKKVNLCDHIVGKDGVQYVDIDSFVHTHYSMFFDSSFNSDLQHRSMNFITIPKNKWSDQDLNIYNFLKNRDDS